MQNHLNEISTMHFEDMASLNIRSLDEAYAKGRSDMLKFICDELSKTMKIKISSDTPDDVVKQIFEVFSLKNTSKIVHFIETDLPDLYKLYKDIEKIISLAEQGLADQEKLKIKNFRFNLKIQNNQYLSSLKTDIAEAFGNITEPNIDENTLIYISGLKKEIEDLKNNKFDDFIIFDQNLGQIRDETFDYYINKDINLTFNTQDIMMLKYQRQQKKMIIEKEWNLQEIKQMKEKYRMKIKNLDLRKLEISEYERVLNKKNLDIVKDRHEIERLREAYYIEKNRILKNYEMKTKKLNETITELAAISFNSLEGFGKISPLTETELISDVSYSSDNDTSFDCLIVQDGDVTIMQKRINDLESMHKTESCLEEQERIKREIDSLRNQITIAKSSALLKSCAQSQKKFTNTVKTRPSPLSESAFIAKRPSPMSFHISSNSGRMSIGSSQIPPTCPYSRSARSTMTSPKSASQTFNFSDILPKEINEHDNAMRKYLRAQELKLKEKEEQFEKEREKWMQKWNKTPNANELIPMVKKEILELKQKSEFFDKFCGEIEKKELEFKVKEEEVGKKEKEIELKAKELADMCDKFEVEKHNIMQILSKLKDNLRNNR
ncbi:hypothetical protein SteCoe_18592 [Stentor coeruleus]|uniref:Uncharacterized protein n=1 Tax=Stentor coeruleus TaxID=5963 RepID=A0A1R2BW34_9CILI|nr:hypothetical protein SteCoe_18592 [Stentor coeruleus]